MQHSFVGGVSELIAFAQELSSTGLQVTAAIVTSALASIIKTTVNSEIAAIYDAFIFSDSLASSLNNVQN